MIPMKFKGGVPVKTRFGKVAEGDIVKVPDKEVEELNPLLWEVVDTDQKKKKADNKGDK